MTSSPPFSVMDLTTHGLGTRGVLNWILWRWKLDPDSEVLVVTEIREADKTNRKLRVLLATTRKSMRMAGDTNMEEFGFNTEIIPWENSNGIKCEALMLKRQVYLRHIIREMMIVKG